MVWLSRQPLWPVLLFMADIGWEFGGVDDEFVDVGIGVSGLK
jgi:hypothetical protein